MKNCCITNRSKIERIAKLRYLKVTKSVWLLLTLCICIVMTSCQSSSPHPTALAKVSVICPTFNRPERHANLYATFAHQTYENRELLVLDDSPEPSPFFTNLRDPRVKYQHLPKRTSIGFKRNFLANIASGEFIAHFDDDDYYAPTYLAEMIEKLGSADLIKLSKWLAWRELDGTLWEWDTRRFSQICYVINGNDRNSSILDVEKLKESDAAFTGQIAGVVEANTWGYGFSYVYRKTLWQECPFEDLYGGEDYNFICKARSLNKVMIHTPDLSYLVLHTLHPKSTSRIFPQYRHDASMGIKTLGEQATPWLLKRAA